MIWRLATSEHIHDGLAAIQGTYTVEDIYDAHEVLDVIEALTKESRAKAKAESNRKGK